MNAALLLIVGIVILIIGYVTYGKWLADQWGVGEGIQGQSYAIPTMQGGVETIKPYVDRFLDLAYEWDQNTFLVTRIGCGIAGFTPEQIAPLFDRALDMYNVVLPRDFYDILIARRKRLGIPLPPGITD